MSENEQINQSNETKNEKPKKKGWMLLVVLLLLLGIGAGVYYNYKPSTPVMNEVTEEAVVEEVVEPEKVIPEKVYTFTDMEFKRYFIPKKSGYIRDLPCKDGNVIRNFEMMEELVPNATCNETGWYRIDDNGTVAYINPDDVDEIKKYLWTTDEQGNPIERTEEEQAAINEYLGKTTEKPVVEEEKKEILGQTDDGHDIIAYAEDGTPILGYTPEGYAINEYSEDGTPIIYFTPQKNNTTTTTNNSTNGSLPYIVNGVDIRSGDYNGDGINDNNGNTWYEMQTWTASNGYTLRIVDKLYVDPGAHNPLDAIFVDGTENLEPTSPFKIAMNEYLGELSLTSISPKDLPSVNTVSTKQTSINVNDPSLLAYKAAFDPLWQKQNGGSLSKLYISNDMIALIDATVGYHFLWDIAYDASRGDWAFKIIGSYTELQWNAVKNAIRMITPDADAVFDVIYKACYEGYPGLECEKYGETDWITIGSTQLKGDWTTGALYVRFK